MPSYVLFEEGFIRVPQEENVVNPEYDVAVIGAGPAGSTTARLLGKRGYRTILLDRRSKVGIPVQCGELLPTQNELLDIFPRSKRMQNLSIIPRKYVTNQTHRTQLISPNGYTIEFEFCTHILDRVKYDQYLSQLAIDAGCELSLQSTVIERNSSNLIRYKTKTGRKELEAKVVVGADGPSSLISKTLGNTYSNPNMELSSAINYVMEGVDCDQDVIQMFFGKNIAPGGYSWIIPKGDSKANVGLGLRRSLCSSRVSLTTYLNHFIRKNKILAPYLKRAKIVSRVGAIIPVAGPVSTTSTDNALLVGDAAGHIMASNGGGIPTALAGGSIAGSVISAFLDKETPLCTYDRIWKHEFGKELYTALSILRIADRVMLSDPLTDICMRLGGRQFLEPLIRCRLPAPVDFVSKTFVRAFNAIVN